MGSFHCSRSFGKIPNGPLPILTIVHDSFLVSSFVEVVSHLTATDLSRSKGAFARIESDQHDAAAGNELGSGPFA